MSIVMDYTDFNAGEWGDWQRAANGSMLEIVYQEDTGGTRNGFLRFPDGFGSLNGRIIHKSFTQLNIGATYRFSARVRRYRKQEQPAAPDLHFQLGAVGTRHLQSSVSRMKSGIGSRRILWQRLPITASG